jgi:7,8-dihydropterin-6-yl-methyl-4-(beta-D-ribofuranosyl)aminobenzene 5'-phosphate synthase
MLLKEADKVELTSLMDNTIDFLSTNERREVKKVQEWLRERRNTEWLEKHFRRPLAEHGFSMLVRVFSGGDSHTIIFDTGISPKGVVTNAERMGINLAEIEAIILSHGHLDHAGGLVKVVKAIDKRDLPIIMHEDMCKTRGTANPDGTVRKAPSFPTEDMVHPARFVKIKEPYALADNTILVTGEIPRKTDFEKGHLKQMVYVNGKWQPDPWIWDDRAMILNLKDKGLVVIAGCAHAGIINTLLYAQQITGVNRVYAVFGGFHLAGKDYETRITPTVDELKKLNPKLIVPSHCTGWRGIYAIREAMPKAFVWNSVGNMYQL